MIWLGAKAPFHSYKQEEERTMKHIDVVFDGPPGPIAGRFVEVEDDTGQSIRFGKWVERPDGYWVIRIQLEDCAPLVLVSHS